MPSTGMALTYITVFSRARFIINHGCHLFSHNSQAFFSIQLQMASLSFTSVSSLHLWAGHQRTWNTPILKPFRLLGYLILYVLMHLFSQPCFAQSPLVPGDYMLWWLYSCNFNISKKHTSKLLTLTPGPASVVLEDVAADLVILIWSKPLR